MIYIGSDEHCRIRIFGEGVSAYHASLSLDGELICMELFSSNTAILNDNIVEGGRYWLQLDDKVVIGDNRLNLFAIKTLLLESDDGSRIPLVYQEGTTEDMSDAVIIKRNPWPIFIVMVIIMGIVVFLVRNMKQHRMHREQVRQEIQIRQDSLLKIQKSMDSLNDMIEQLQTE